MKKIGLGLAILVIIGLSGCSSGKSSFDELKNLDYGISTDKVIEYVGKPKSKTIDKDEIYNWAPDSIINDPKTYTNLEMFVYEYDGKEAHIFFSNDSLIFKKPIGLNNIPE